MNTTTTLSTRTPATPAATAATGPPTLVPTAELVPERLGILPWQVGTGGGHDPRSAYVETFWLPVLGPSTVLLLRRLSHELDARPEGFEIETVTLSREIGLGHRLNKRSPFVRTLDRCTKFHLALFEGPVLHVRRRMPPLSPRQLQQLSPRLQQMHDNWGVDTAADGPTRRAELVRAAHLARTLLSLGESPHATERQLDTWGFAPAVAWHGVHWA